MTAKKDSFRIATVVVALMLAPLIAVSAEGQKPAAEGAKDALTVERVTAEADLGPQTRPEAARQAPLLRWSPDGARVAWLHLVAPPPNSPVKAPQQEIWFQAVDGSKPPAVLVTTAKVTACLRGTDTPQPLSINEDDKSNPDLLQDFAWSPDHGSLLLVGKQSLAWLDLASGKSRVLLTAEEPLGDAAISPDGKTVSFVRSHNLWTVSVSGGAARSFTHSAHPDLLEGELDWPYRNELHLAHGYAWSPDSTQIAWLETDDRAVAKYTIGLSNGTTRQIVSPKPGGAVPVVRVFVKRVIGGLPVEIRTELKNGYLPRFQWLPDSRHVAIQRLDRRQQTLDLLLGDTTTGKTQLILTEKDKYWINLAGDPIFLKDGKRFVWSSERTGSRHLYLYDVQGKQLVQLTHGDWEVTELNALDEAQSAIYFTATEKTPLERHLYRVSLAGEDFIQVTHQPGTHESYFAPGAADYLDSYSNHTTPPKFALARIGEIPADAPSQTAAAAAIPNLLPVEFLTLKLHMGVDVHAFMIKPPAFDAGKKYPVIVYLAGGPGEQLVRDAWGGATGLWMQLMAQKGYIVFALDNQGTAGRGHIFEEPLHFRLAAQEMIDQRDGLAYLLSQPFVDPARLGVCGSGYGGFLVVHAMVDRPVAYKAGFAAAPVIDWKLYNAVFSERYLDDPVAYLYGWLSSTVFESSKFLKGRLLIAQGTADEYVHMENLLALQGHLVNSGKSADVLLLPDRGHSIEDEPARTVYFRAMTDFFVKNL